MVNSDGLENNGSADVDHIYDALLLEAIISGSGYYKAFDRGQVGDGSDGGGCFGVPKGT